MLSLTLAMLLATTPTGTHVSRSRSTQINRVDTVVTPTYEKLNIVAVEPGAQYLGSHGNIAPDYYTPDTYYGGVVGDYLRAESRQNQADSAAIPALVNAINALSARLEVIAQKVGIAPAAVPTNEAPPVQPTPTNPAPQPTPEAPVLQPAPSSDAGAAALKVFTTRCKACHLGATPSGGFALFSAPDKLAPLTAEQLVLIDYMTYAGLMPPGPKHQALDTNEYNDVRAWLNEQTDLIVTSMQARGSK